MRVLGIIPARYASTRLPGKPLADIGGKTLIEHVYRRAAAAAGLESLVVATDDLRIARAVEGFGGKAVMTDPNHKSGSDRCAEVACCHPEYEIIVNIQGDEPLLDPRLIDLVVAPLIADASLDMSTVAKVMAPADYGDPNVVKVVMDLNGRALYFSRSLIPYPRGESPTVYQHVGLYCYRRDFLLHLTGLPRSPLEEAESLEQLRVLEHGHSIRVMVADFPVESVSVDTPADLERVRAIIDRKAAD